MEEEEEGYVYEMDEEEGTELILVVARKYTIYGILLDLLDCILAYFGSRIKLGLKLQKKERICVVLHTLK